MVWSPEDFAREIRRQLVELESLRRKAGCRRPSPESEDGSDPTVTENECAPTSSAPTSPPGDAAWRADIEDSIERLEESQHYLLRKLDAFFAARAEPQPQPAASDVPSPDTTATPNPNGALPIDPSDLDPSDLDPSVEEGKSETESLPAFLQAILENTDVLEHLAATAHTDVAGAALVILGLPGAEAGAPRSPGGSERGGGGGLEPPYSLN